MKTSGSSCHICQCPNVFSPKRSHLSTKRPRSSLIKRMPPSLWQRLVIWGWLSSLTGYLFMAGHKPCVICLHGNSRKVYQRTTQIKQSGFFFCRTEKPSFSPSCQWQDLSSFRADFLVGDGFEKYCKYNHIFRYFSGIWILIDSQSRRPNVDIKMKDQWINMVLMNVVLIYQQPQSLSSSQNLCFHNSFTL